MNCKEAKRQVYLFQIDEQSSSEKKQLLEHLSSCVDCRELNVELELYNKEVSKLKSLNLKIEKPSLFTQEIMDSIEREQQQQNNVFSRRLSFTNRLVFRVAGIIIILLISSFFLIQQKEINNSVAQLEVTYFKDKNQNSFNSNYNLCVENSKELINQLVKDDQKLSAYIEQTSTRISSREIKKYASKICQLPVDLSTYSQSEKKQVLYQLLNIN